MHVAVTTAGALTAAEVLQTCLLWRLMGLEATRELRLDASIVAVCWGRAGQVTTT
jgi:hypothetical protein